MNFEYFVQTDPGMIRDGNEDAVAVDDENQLVVLADGMGGYNAGEVASGMAISLVMTELGRWLQEAGAQANGDALKRAMARCTDNAHRAILHAAHANVAYANMGTTLVMGAFVGNCAIIGHVGDSRCYRFRGDTLQQITRDHSLLQEQIDAGLITLEQAKTATHKNLITRALGAEDAVLLDVNEYSVESGDLYLFCSDGLSDMVPDEQMAEILRGKGTLERKGCALVTLANDRGGRDNISVILVQAHTKFERKKFFLRMLG